MATISASSGQGALFELVARGVKDNYFVKDSSQSLFPYDARYESSVPHLAERKTMVPLADAAFGKSFEVEIDAYGDVLTECALEIEMPSWLPPLPVQSGGQAFSPERANGLYPITDINGNSYGYVNYAAYFLFEKIQFYQDQFLIQEWSGDGLLAKQMTEGSWNSSLLSQQKAGLLDTTDPQTGLVTNRGIQLRATPGSLRIVLPLPGTQCPGDVGFPLVAMSWQTFRIKGTLRRLEDLVVCSDSTVFKPAPWSVPQMRYTFPDGVTNYTFTPLTRVQIGAPRILLSTIQQYVPLAVQEELKSRVIEIPFRRQFDNVFTFGELDFIPLDKGGRAAVTRRLDGRHPTERMLWFFRSYNSLDNNRLDVWYNDYFDTRAPSDVQPYSNGEFYYQLKLLIAGRDRESLYEPAVWNQMNTHCKDEKANGMYIGSMNWSTGEKYGTVYPAPRQPEGTVNFTSADRPTLYIELANINSNAVLAQRKAEMRLFTEGWNVYVVKEGRGKVIFAS